MIFKHLFTGTSKNWCSVSGGALRAPPDAKIRVYIMFFLVAVSISHCTGTRKQSEIEISGNAMGAGFTVKYIPGKEIKKSSEIAAEIKEYFIKFQNITSLYQNDSELIRINHSPAFQKIRISHEIGVMLEYALDLSKKTNGVYDVTAGTVSKLWSSEDLTATTSKKPVQKEIEIARRKSGYIKVNLEKIKGKYFLEKKAEGMIIDLASLAAGYVADEISGYLGKNGIKNYLVNIGGEFRASSTGEKKWIVGIENPLNQEQIIKKVSLSNMSMATSGNYKNQSNIIDPNSGKPVHNQMLLVSVFHQSCMQADALATGLFALGVNKAIEYSRLSNIGVLLVYRENGKIKNFYTESFEESIVE
jgi:thiamine biosynthesis lipoprotein